MPKGNRCGGSFSGCDCNNNCGGNISCNRCAWKNGCCGTSKSLLVIGSETIQEDLVTNAPLALVKTYLSAGCLIKVRGNNIILKGSHTYQVDYSIKSSAADHTKAGAAVVHNGDILEESIATANSLTDAVFVSGGTIVDARCGCENIVSLNSFVEDPATTQTIEQFTLRIIQLS